MDGTCIAVDVGGTKIAAGSVSPEGELITTAVTPTPRSDDPEAVFSALSQVVAEVRPGGAAPAVVGVGCGGPMLPGGEEVSPLNIPAWRGFPLRARLESLIEAEVFIDNDAKALALGEGWLGAAASSANFLAMVVSTGVGGGIVLDGRLLDGRLSNAGHVGHVLVEPDGRACACGARGCLEAEASGTAIAEMTGRPAAEAGAAVIDRCGEMVGRAVASAASLLDLDLCVVAGSVALGFGAPFFTAANRSLAQHAGLSFCSEARIVPAGLGPDGPLIGAARVGMLGLEGRAR